MNTSSSSTFDFFLKKTCVISSCASEIRYTRIWNHAGCRYHIVAQAIKDIKRGHECTGCFFIFNVYFYVIQLVFGNVEIIVVVCVYSVFGFCFCFFFFFFFPRVSVLVNYGRNYWDMENVDRAVHRAAAGTLFSKKIFL